MSERKFYILSIEHSTPDLAVWWKDNDAGYTTNLYEAGIYPLSKVEGNAYYNNGDKAVPIPVEEIAIHSHRVVSRQAANDLKRRFEPKKEPKWPRISDLPKNEQEAFKRHLIGQTVPMEPDSYYPDDYKRWKGVNMKGWD